MWGPRGQDSYLVCSLPGTAQQGKELAHPGVGKAETQPQDLISRSPRSQTYLDPLSFPPHSVPVRLIPPPPCLCLGPSLCQNALPVCHSAHPHPAWPSGSPQPHQGKRRQGCLWPQVQVEGAWGPKKVDCGLSELGHWGGVRESFLEAAALELGLHDGRVRATGGRVGGHGLSKGVWIFGLRVTGSHGGFYAGAGK